MMTTTTETTTRTTTGTWSCPGATTLLKAGLQHTDRDAWLAARSKTIGGSEISSVIGKNPYATPYDLWALKTGRVAPVEETDAMRRGNADELGTIKAFEKQTGLTTRAKGMLVRKTARGHSANLDAMTSDGGVLECKSHGRFTTAGKDALAGRIPESARLQIMWNMYVSGRRSAGWFAARIDGTYVVLGPIAYDETEVRELVIAADRMLELIETDTAPPMTSGEELAAIIAAPVDLEKIVQAPALEAADIFVEYQRGKAEEAAGKKIKETASEWIKRHLGDAKELHVGGQVLASWTVGKPSKAIDLKKVQVEAPDLWAQLQAFEVENPGRKAININAKFDPATAEPIPF